MTKTNSNTLFNDFLASIVVFLVALPLCLGIAIASGLPPAAGLITGAIGGIIVGLFAGCPLQVSGPASGLIAIVWEVAQHYGIEAVGLFTFIAGLIQIIIGFLRLAPWFQAVSPAVIHGMLGGIAILIFGSQFHVMVDDNPRTNGLQNLLSIPESLMKGLIPSDDSTHHFAALIGIITIVVIVLWNTLPKEFKIIPPSLMGIFVAVFIAHQCDFAIKFVEFPDKIGDAINIIDFNNLKQLLRWEELMTIFTMAFIASAESLLTSKAVDQMHTGKQTNYNQEIISQGIGNTVSGFLGAMPITGVIVRSGTNVQAGAKTRWSTILHGIWITLALLFFGNYIEMIPKSALAAILVYVSIKLFNIDAIKKISRFGQSEVAIYGITVFTIVATNLLLGVVLGIMLSLFKFLHHFSQLSHETIEHKDGTLEVVLHGCGSFTCLPAMTEILNKIPSKCNVVLSFRDLQYVDHAFFDALGNWEKLYTNKGGNVAIEWGKMVHSLKK